MYIPILAKVAGSITAGVLTAGAVVAASGVTTMNTDTPPPVAAPVIAEVPAQNIVLGTTLVQDVVETAPKVAVKVAAAGSPLAPVVAAAVAPQVVAAAPAVASAGCAGTGTTAWEPATRSAYDAGVLDCVIPADLASYATAAFDNASVTRGDTTAESALGWIPTKGFSVDKYSAFTPTLVQDLAMNVDSFAGRPAQRTDPGALVDPTIKLVSLGPIHRNATSKTVSWTLTPTVWVYTAKGVYWLKVHVDIQTVPDTNSRGYAVTLIGVGLNDATLH